MGYWHYSYCLLSVCLRLSVTADDDDDDVAMERLPAQLGTVRVRWNQRHSHPTGESLEAGHRTLQQVSESASVSKQANRIQISSYRMAQKINPDYYRNKFVYCQPDFIIAVK